MGASFSRSTSDVQQKALIDLYTEVGTQCTTFTNQTLRNVNITIVGSSVGDITVGQKSNTTAECIIDNSITTIAQNVLDNVQDTETDPGKRGLFANLGVNVKITKSTTVQEVETAIRTVINNLCATESAQLIENVNITIGTSRTGDIGLEQDADARSNCAITTIANINALNKLDSDNKTGGRGQSIIVTILIIATVGIVLTGLLTAVLGRGNKNTAESGCELYPCDALSGKDYLDCTVKTPFDPVRYCAPDAVVGPDMEADNVPV